MASVTSINLRTNMAEQFKESVSEPTPNTAIYLTYGRTIAWSNEASPDGANTSPASVYEVWRNMIGGKKITGNDLYHVIPRINWANNTSFPAYDHLSSNVMNYVMTSDYNVYKCLANNNNGTSNTKPTSVSATNDSSTPDGYIWKYMFTLNGFERARYLTSEYIPVKTLMADDGSLQWDVQENATDGKIHSIIVLSGGTGYDNASNITIAISGSGQDATATASINAVSNTISSITMTGGGTGYTRATVTITDAGSGSGASARAIIAPPGGHGSNPLYELGGSMIMINSRIVDNENDQLRTTNDHRQIALIKDPFIKDADTVSTNTVFSQSTVLTTVGAGDYDLNETVYQGASLAASSFSAVVLDWDDANGKIYVINAEGTATAGNPLNGANTSTGRYIASIQSPDLERFTGQLMYIDNVLPITKAADQTEEYRIVIKF